MRERRFGRVTSRVARKVRTSLASKEGSKKESELFSEYLRFFRCDLQSIGLCVVIYGKRPRWLRSGQLHHTKRGLFLSSLSHYSGGIMF